MVIIFDGNSEKVAHVNSNLRLLICLCHLISKRAVTNRIYFFFEKAYFPSCVRNML